MSPTEKTPKRGILLILDPDQARGLMYQQSPKLEEDDVPELGPDDIEELSQELHPDDAVIGIVAEDSRWIVKLTARVSSEGFPQLKWVDYKSTDEMWELPIGYPRDRHFDDHGYELLTEKAHVESCLVGASDLLSCLKDRPAKHVPHMPLSAGAADNLVIIFRDGKPIVLSERETQRRLIKSPQAYSKFMRDWLRSFSGQTTMGYEFEDFLKEFLRAQGEFDVPEHDGQSHDGGVDLSVTKRNSLVGVETYVIQAKNTTEPVGPAVVQQLRGTCCNESGAKGILISVGGFTGGAKSEAEKHSDYITLINWNELWALLGPVFNKGQMPESYGKFIEWFEEQPALPGT